MKDIDGPTRLAHCNYVHYPSYKFYVSQQMEADKIVKVDCLIWDDAWDLFKKKKVGDQPFLVYHDFPKLTRIIAT
uniref:Uncharacterized protein n=1 Tax=Populus trichocarpa TaxID=3694 RepID=B9N0X0_POPTR